MEGQAQKGTLYDMRNGIAVLFYLWTVCSPLHVASQTYAVTIHRTDLRGDCASLLATLLSATSPFPHLLAQ